MSNKMLYIQGSMMVLALFGYLLRKNDVINDNGIQIISILVTKFILPMNIFCSCMLSFSLNRAYDIGVMILSGIIVEIAIVWGMPINPECKGISIILLGMPLASASAMYAKEYKGDYMFAAKSVALSTVSSFLSLVLLSKIIEISNSKQFCG